MNTSFVPGRCYVNLAQESDSPTVMVCRKSFFSGLVLTPYSGLLKRSLACSSEAVSGGNWVDCTEPVKRSQAINQYSGCPAVSITNEHIGTVIAFNEEGTMSAPHFLFAYQNGIAYLMSLDGRDKVFNLQLSQCYPLQAVYKDVTERAVSEDPLSSSIFDDFFRWLKGNRQYTNFRFLAEATPIADREDMIRLFEVMSYDGVTATTFEAEVKRRYDALSSEQKGDLSMYAAVLATYRSKTTKYTKVELEIMRATNFKYDTPQKAWEAVAGTTPFPKSYADAVKHIPSYGTAASSSIRPEEYIRDTLGLYESSAAGYWTAYVCLMLGEWLDMETEYIKGCTQFLQMQPQFDMHQLDFIAEEDKVAVFKRLLQVQSLDAKDPFRAWIKNPPQHLKRMKETAPVGTPYVALFKQLYEKERAST